ncbi:glycosyltransferase family 2 protein [Rothia sp. ZJ932]|uniref:glycosyltransferase family 2 protein n=1 Tax=Rothia sp. ZJ932 TaxID=2810516 RepID=UPI001F083498|nr:glycosyltransferase family 2 protein [Rothia sp. ZJ932]
MIISTVAIIVRTKDRPTFLTRALANIAAQTYPHYNVVVVNDGGATAPVDRIVATAGLGEKVQVLHREVSEGMEAASNAGIRASASDYIAIHDDDDLWEPTFLEKTVARLEQTGAAMVTVRIDEYFERITDAGIFKHLDSRPFWGFIQGVHLHDLFRINRAVPIGILHRRSLHDELGYYEESLPVVGDWEFNLRVAQRYPVEFVDENLAHWSKRVNATGANANSTVAGFDAHRHYDACVREEAVRDHLTSGGHAGPYLFAANLANEVQGAVDEAHASVRASAGETADMLRGVSEKLDRIEHAQREQAERLARIEKALSVKDRVRSVLKRG